MLSLLAEKAIILAGMFITTICFGIIPIKLIIWSSSQSRRPPWLKKAISLANCFSGGVFVAACLLDLFPDVHESVDGVLDEIEKKYHTSVDYPVAEFVIVFGFLLILIIEQVIMEIQDHWKASTPDIQIPTESASINATVNNSYGATDSVSISADPDATETDALVPAASSLASSDEGQLLRQRYISGNSATIEHHEDDEHTHAGPEMFEEHSALRSLILLMALTFHSLFEGMAIGLQNDYGQLISIFVAVIIHKAIMAFSLGLNLAQSHKMTTNYFVVANLIFSLASPIGMGIGMALADMPPSITRDIANGVLQGIAGGTFLYITFFEVLPHEFTSNKMRLPKVLCVLVGYSAICGLLFLTH